MSFALILRRIRRDGRVFAVLLVAMTLVTGFFALSPLYIRSVAESALRYTVANAYPGTFNPTLTNTERTDRAYEPILREELGDLITSIELVTRAGGVFCDPPGNICTGDNYRAYLPIGFSRLEDRFTLADGRFPQDTGTTESLEAVITRRVSEQSHYGLGDSFTLNGVQTPTVTVTIVGLVDPVDADNPFWDTLSFVTVGQITDVTSDIQRFDFGVIIPENAYDRVISPISAARAGDVYQWVIETNPDGLRASSLDALSASLDQTEARFRQHYPQIALTGGLRTLISDFQAKIAAAEGPVILLSGAVLLLMVYQLMTTTALILEGQQIEWAAITSRGGSVLQLIQLQTGTLILLGLIAFIAGLPLARGLLWVLERIGPLAAILDGAPRRVEGIPLTSAALSLAAALLMIVALTLPALPAARQGILSLKGSISRPPTRPAWARYFLDLILLLIGFVFLLRLYFLVGGDAVGGIGSVFTNPAQFIRLIGTGGDSTLLNDPFNLAGTALILIGAALLWLRLFPLLMHLISAVFSRLNGLMFPLALWSVERDPNHYAQLVMLLIATLALGTASLALSATHDTGAWEVARRNMGGSAQITFTSGAFDPAALPDVTSSVSLMKFTTLEMEGEPRTTVIGIDPATFSAYTSAVDVTPLAAEPAFPRSGLELPTSARTLTMQVFATPLENISTRLALDLVNDIGVPLTIPMSTANEMLTGSFMTFSATLPIDNTYVPWRLVGIHFLSRVEEQGAFQHTLYLDALSVSDAAGNVTLLDDFERTAMPEWTSLNQRGTGLFTTPTTSQAASGLYSLRIEYTIAQRGALFIEPLLLAYRAPGVAPIVPILASRDFAVAYGRRTDNRQPLEIGSTGTATLQLAQADLEFRYRVVGILPDFPTTQPTDRYFVARIDHLQPILNPITTLADFYAPNQAWVTFSAREPSAEFIAAVSGTDTRYANSLYNALRREPLPNAITGMLFTGFWVSLGLGLLDFAFYLAMTARRRATSFAVLRALGWHSNKLWGLLSVEQVTLVTPALVVGVLLGALLAYLLLPFLALLGGETLQLPIPAIGALLIVLVIAFTLLLAAAAYFLQRMSINQVLREE